MDWSRIDREAKDLRKIILHGVNVQVDEELNLPEDPPGLTPLQKLRNKPFGEQYYIAEELRRRHLRDNIDELITKIPMALLILYTDEGLDADFLQSIDTHRPQMPPKKIREKTETELAIEYEAWAERKATDPTTKRPRRAKAKELLLQNSYVPDEIAGFRITPTGFRYVVKWKGYSIIDATREFVGLSTVRYLVRRFWDRFFSCCFEGFEALEDTFFFARLSPPTFDHQALEQFTSYLTSQHYEPIVEPLQAEIAKEMEDEQSEYESPVLDLPPPLQVPTETAREDSSDESSSPDTNRRYPKRKRAKKFKSLAVDDGPKEVRAIKKVRRTKKKVESKVSVSLGAVQADEATEQAVPAFSADTVQADLAEETGEAEIVSEIEASEAEQLADHVGETAKDEVGEPTEQAAPQDSSQEALEVVEEVAGEEVVEDAGEVVEEVAEEGEVVEEVVEEGEAGAVEAEEDEVEAVEAEEAGEGEEVAEEAGNGEVQRALPFPCGYLGCGESFSTRQRKWNHRYGKHKELLCHICNTPFSRQKFRAHLKVCEAQRQKQIIQNTCETCEVVFATNPHKKDHRDKRKGVCSCRAERVLSYARWRKDHKSCGDFTVTSCPPVDNFHVFGQ